MTKPETAPPPPAAELAPDRVYRLREFCRITGFSEPTFRRIRKAGKGPPLTQYSDYHEGVRGRDGIDWLESRRTKPSESAS